MIFFWILLFLLLSALFSGTEIAFVSASKLKVELKRQQGSRRGGILARFYDKPAEFLSTMLVGNNIALILFTLLIDQVLRESLGIENQVADLLINTIAGTIIILIFGEFLPKTFFRLYADELLYYLALPIRFLQFLLYFPAWIMTRLSNRMLRLLFKTPIEKVDTVITRLDLENFVKSSQPESSEELNTELFEKALHLKHIKVKECMVPRTEIKAIDITSSIDELRQLFIETRLSRLIVTDGDIENICGYIYHQQMFKSLRSIEEAIIEIPFVPEAMQVRDLMNMFIKDQINIACVVDEYGGIAGIVTFEDILEEIFGEIEDEHDQEEYVEVQVSEVEYIFSGRLEIDYLNEKYEHLEFPEGEYHTLSGYLVMTTETIPEQGAEIELGGYRFILELVSDTKIETIRVQKLEEVNEEVAD